jgi:ribbon-helix-helix protein, copG family
MAIEKAPEGYGITGDIGGPTEWYSGPPVGEGGRTVTVSITTEQFEELREIALVTGMTMGAVVRKASREHAKATVEDPGFRQEVKDLAARLDKYNPKPNPRESE